MILKALRKNGAVTINYYKNGLLQTFKGKVQRLDLTDQTLSLKDEQQNTFSIRLSGIKEIYWWIVYSKKEHDAHSALQKSSCSFDFSFI